MNSPKSPQLLLKIVTGTAWLDGKVQMEEQEYLKRIAKANDLMDDPELSPLICGLKRVTREECYQWVEDYLGPNPSQEDQNQLIEVISGLIYSDGVVDSAEAKLLTDVGNINQSSSPIRQFKQRVIRGLQKVYTNLEQL